MMDQSASCVAHGDAWLALMQSLAFHAYNQRQHGPFFCELHRVQRRVIGSPCLLPRMEEFPFPLLLFCPDSDPIFLHRCHDGPDTEENQLRGRLL